VKLQLFLLCVAVQQILHICRFTHHGFIYLHNKYCDSPLVLQCAFVLICACLFTQSKMQEVVSVQCPSMATLISCNTECTVIILITVLELIVAHRVLVICVQSGVSADESQGMKRKRG
jgi:hypothetical protein